MAPMKDRIVCITGASAGIGAATGVAFAREGASLILCARREERLKEISRFLRSRFDVRTLAVVLDIRDRAAVETAVASLPEEWAAVDLLVNNAGMARGLDPLQQGDPDDWAETFDTNVIGLLSVTRALLPGMIERGRGHVIQIGSIAGREVYPGGGVYCASKFAVKALSRALKIDLLGTPVRVSTVDPGLVETEFSMVRFRGDEKRAKKVYEGLEPLSPEDIADAVVWVASRPAHVDVTEMVILPTAQSSAMLTHREE